MSESTTDLLCPFCGYNLRGTPGDVCSECGKPIDRSSLAESQIPWVHRRRIGRVRAFFKTAWMVTWRPGKLAEEMNRPVSLRDAMAFRRVVVGLICLPAWGVLVTAMLAMWNKWDWEWVQNADVRDLLTLIPPPWTGILWIVLAGIFWWGVLGAVSLFVRARGMERERQNKAVALSYYVGATWLLMYPIYGILAGIFVISLMTERDVPWALTLLMGIAQIVAAGMTAWRICWVPLVFIKRVTHCGMGRMLWAIIGLPLCMAGMGFVVWTLMMLAILCDVIRVSLQ